MSSWFSDQSGTQRATRQVLDILYFHSLARADRFAKRGQKGWREGMSVSNASRGRAARQRRLGSPSAKRAGWGRRGSGCDGGARGAITQTEASRHRSQLREPGKPARGKSGKCAKEDARHSASVLPSQWQQRCQSPMRKAERGSHRYREVAGSPRGDTVAEGFTATSTGKPRVGHSAVGLPCAPSSTKGVSHVLQHRELQESVCQSLRGTRDRLNGPPRFSGRVAYPASHGPPGANRYG